MVHLGYGVRCSRGLLTNLDNPGVFSACQNLDTWVAVIESQCLPLKLLAGQRLRRQGVLVTASNINVLHPTENRNPYANAIGPFVLIYYCPQLINTPFPP